MDVRIKKILKLQDKARALLNKGKYKLAQALYAKADAEIDKVGLDNFIKDKEVMKRMQETGRIAAENYEKHKGRYIKYGAIRV